MNVLTSSRASSAPTWVLRYPQIQHLPTIHCGSELARDSSGSACIGIECTALIASKLGSHMGSSVPTDSASTHMGSWGPTDSASTHMGSWGPTDSASVHNLSGDRVPHQATMCFSR
nr:hypothetical protein C1892_14865 [Pseudomonas sp. MPBD7-1]